MKKITFILFTLIAGTTFAQNSANATAPVKATIVAPIGITLQSGTVLDFGTFTSPKSSAGTVTVSPGGLRSFGTDDEMQILTSNTGTPSVPTFNITGDLAESTYNILLSVSEIPNDDSTGVTELALSDLKHSLANDTGNNATTFTVGGTLTVPIDATPDVYTGEITVTVKYD